MTVMYRKDTYKIKKKKMEEKKMRKTHRTKALIATTVAALSLIHISRRPGRLRDQ